MSYGVIARNEAGHVLISSEFETPHFAGKAEFVETIKSGLTEFPNYTFPAFHEHLYEHGEVGYNYYKGLNDLKGRHVHRYRIATTAKSSPPLFFLKKNPRDVENKLGILQQRKRELGSFKKRRYYWEVDVLQQGRYSLPPTVFAFALPSDLPEPTDEKYGLATYLPNGRKAFDSRLKPLVIHRSFEIAPPETPFTWPDGDLSPIDVDDLSHAAADILTWNSRMTSSNYIYFPPEEYLGNELMFSAPSVAQSVCSLCREGWSAHGNLLSGRVTYSWNIWWVMYHQVYGVFTNVITAGWAMYEADHYKPEAQIKKNILGKEKKKVRENNGTQPYIDKTINVSKNTIIIADASLYE